MYFVYILLCDDGTLYTGITTDLSRRVDEHRKGKGARYTRSRGVNRLLYSAKKRTRASAQKEEARIKRLARSEKLALIWNKAHWTPPGKRNRMTR